MEVLKSDGGVVSMFSNCWNWDHWDLLDIAAQQQSAGIDRPSALEARIQGLQKISGDPWAVAASLDCCRSGEYDEIHPTIDFSGRLIADTTAMLRTQLAARQQDIQTTLRELVLAVSTAIDYDTQLVEQLRQHQLEEQKQQLQQQPSQEHQPQIGSDPAGAPQSPQSTVTPAEPHPQYELALRHVYQCLARFEQACDQLALGLHAYVDRLDAKRSLELLQPTDGGSEGSARGPAQQLQDLLASVEQVDKVYEALRALDPAEELKPSHSAPQGGEVLRKGTINSFGSLCQI